jgi:hypothetical protein
VSLANLFNVPRSLEDWNVWAFSHMDQHRQIAFAIQRKKSVTLAQYALDPMPFQSLGVWVWNHQQMHNAMNSALDLSGFDLTGLDIENKGQVAAWIRLHSSEHVAAAAALGI